MLKLPFHIVDEGLSRPNPFLGLSKTWKPFKADIGALRELNKTQTIALKLLLKAETEWVQPYLEAISQDNEEFDFGDHRQFLAEYCHGLVRMACAHAILLEEQQSSLSNLNPLVQLQSRLSGRLTLAARARTTAERDVTPRDYGELARWAYVGTTLFFQDQALKKAQASSSSSVDFPSSSATSVAYLDYFTHEVGDNLLMQEHLDRPSLITCLTSVSAVLRSKA